MRSGTGSQPSEPWQPSRKSLVHAIELMRRAVYFEHLAIVGFDIGGDASDATLIYGDWPDEFVQAYERDGWRQRDPVFDLLLRKSAPLMPAEIRQTLAADSHAEPYLAFIEQFGVPVPVVLPVFHLQEIAGAVAIGRTKPFAPEEVHFFALIAPTLHREFAGDLRADLGGAKLTRREVECLRHASKGMTSEEIALVMPLAAATVTAQIRSAAAKLGATNRVAAIAEAIRRGIIE